MKTYLPLGVYSITALAAITPKLFVGLTGAVCGADAKSLGVSEVDTDPGEQCPVIISGIALVTSGAAVSVGAEISSNAAGKAITQVAGAINGYALDEATAADQAIRILLV
ncbi:MAG: DUF2190 domain-containing protein [Ignavibacteria bacterium CG08_land_8_20_14_0_20_37_9]|nr:MAG: DUF2190 domain-containing protein [Ignavibacteria bacterium CG08_land_8_20_14_0_20_37_9]PIX93033.1 MAG: DUF2190 domain-containing protein [Ignavibacteria bacterium CG_4_10_14_3_um_filter_37_18]PJC58786.1 MAG: DUF2190 domain-containing protein [Ignavibacteria bacterium CG_4_9_14_0_2_um_filter_37_13]